MEVLHSLVSINLLFKSILAFLLTFLKPSLVLLICASVSQVRYWRNQGDGEGGAQRVVVPGQENHTRLEGLKPDSHYLIEVRGYNSAGYGPPSEHLRIHTKKPRM